MTAFEIRKLKEQTRCFMKASGIINVIQHEIKHQKISDFVFKQIYNRITDRMMNSSIFSEQCTCRRLIWHDDDCGATRVSRTLGKSHIIKDIAKQEAWPCHEVKLTEFTIPRSFADVMGFPIIAPEDDDGDST